MWLRLGVVLSVAWLVVGSFTHFQLKSSEAETKIAFYDDLCVLADNPFGHMATEADVRDCLAVREDYARENTPELLAVKAVGFGIITMLLAWLAAFLSIGVGRWVWAGRKSSGILDGEVRK